MKSLSPHSFVVIFLGSLSSLTMAQNDNIWSWNFNTPSTLFVGSVVGGSAGSSAVSYNAALIDQGNMPNLSLSAKVVSLQFLNGKNIAGDGKGAEQFIFLGFKCAFVIYTQYSRIGDGDEFKTHNCLIQLKVRRSLV